MNNQASLHPIIPIVSMVDQEKFISFLVQLFGKDSVLVSSNADGFFQINIIGSCFWLRSTASESRSAELLIYVDDVMHIYRMAERLACTLKMEPTLMGFGFAMEFVDPFGIHWVIVQG